MIELILPKNNQHSSYIRDRINEMSLRVSIQEPKFGDLILRENLSEYVGIDKIHSFLEDMVIYKAEWEKFQTDACYLDSCSKVQ
jgi:hypothetical protein